MDYLQRLSLWVALSVLFPSAAFAAWGTIIPSGADTLTYVTGGVEVSNGPGTGSMFLGRTFGAPAVGSTGSQAALVSDTMRISSGAAQGLEVVGTRAVSMEALAATMSGVGTVAGIAVASAAAVAAAGQTGFQIGGAVSHFLGNDNLRIGATRCVATYGGWQCDSGTLPERVVNTEYECTLNGPTRKASTLTAACTAAGNASTVANHSVSFDFTFSNLACDEGRTLCTYTGVNTYHNIPGGGDLVQSQPNQTAYASARQVATDSCPASIDALNPLYSTPSGGSAGTDGKCPTGRYSAPTAQYLQDRLKTYADPTAAPDVVKGWLDSGKPIYGADPVGITGPTVGPSVSTRTDTTDGTGTTTKIETTQPRYTYTPTKIGITPETTTTTTHPDGSVTGTTSTTTGSNPSSGTTTLPDYCVDHPERIGCKEITEAPNVPFEPTEVPVQMNPQDWGGGGGCPADRVLNLHGITVNWSWAPLCDFMTGIRFAVVAMAWISAISIFVGARND